MRLVKCSYANCKNFTEEKHIFCKEHERFDLRPVVDTEHDIDCNTNKYPPGDCDCHLKYLKDDYMKLQIDKHYSLGVFKGIMGNGMLGFKTTQGNEEEGYLYNYVNTHDAKEIISLILE